MAPQTPPVDSLQRPEKLSIALKSDTKDDCLSCRLVGKPSSTTCYQTCLETFSDVGETISPQCWSLMFVARRHVQRS